MVKNPDSRFPSSDMSFNRVTGDKREPEDIVLNKASANITGDKDKFVTRYTYNDTLLIANKIIPEGYT